MRQPDSRYVGILLAAGRGMRFDPSGAQNKLLQPIAGGATVVAAAAKNLLTVLPAVLAVVRPGADAVEAQLRAAGCAVTTCPDADQGMGASLVHALSHHRDAAGWVIALADMPYVQPGTVDALIDALEHGADIAVPANLGRRGNPVAFSRAHLNNLLRLGGDQGARSLLTAFPVVQVKVDDAGIHRDIDTAADLEHRAD
ncbi:MAG: MobA-related protein [Herminiimonas sp.]|nr:MobA-related protein [Herminiimonas sp.]